MSATINPIVANPNGTTINSCTWAARPSAVGAANGQWINVTDVGPTGGSLWYSNGTRWLPVGGEVILGQSGVAGTTLTGATGPVYADLCVVPAGLLGPNGQLIVTALWSCTSSANNKTMSIGFSSGATVMYSATVTAVASLSCQATLSNRGGEAANVCHTNVASGLGGSPTTSSATSLDTAAAKTVQSGMTLVNTGESLTLERWAVVARPF